MCWWARGLTGKRLHSVLDPYNYNMLPVCLSYFASLSRDHVSPRDSTVVRGGRWVVALWEERMAEVVKIAGVCLIVN